MTDSLSELYAVAGKIREAQARQEATLEVMDKRLDKVMALSEKLTALFKELAEMFADSLAAQNEITDEMDKRVAKLERLARRDG